MNQTLFFPLLLLIYLTIPQFGHAQDIQALNSYQATFDVLRNGKVMAEQKTKLAQVGADQFLLNDLTLGKHGLASLTGFERSEGSYFSVLNSSWVVSKHNMQQKVTFSKRDYAFHQNKKIIPRISSIKSIKSS